MSYGRGDDYAEALKENAELKKRIADLLKEQDELRTKAGLPSRAVMERAERIKSMIDEMGDAKFIEALDTIIRHWGDRGYRLVQS